MHTQQMTQNIDLVSANAGDTATELQPQSAISEETTRWDETAVYHEDSVTRSEG